MTSPHGVDAGTIARHLDVLLKTDETPDYPHAFNGLQLANRAIIRRVAAAVDFSLRTIAATIAEDANLLIVHHGMFWDGARRITGGLYDRLRPLFEHDIAVYASHLPLDAHPALGNNALLARELGLDPTAGFARYQALAIGVSGSVSPDQTLLTEELIGRVQRFAAQHGGNTVTTACDPQRVTRRWGICTGAGASSETLREAAALGIDTLIVGEGPHHTAVAAPEAGVVIVYAGHYATETLGVRALAKEVESVFGIPGTFVHAPTGL